MTTAADDEPLRRRIRHNLESVRGRMADACLRAGRPADSVLLVAVTKSADAAGTRIVAECGCTDLAEGRPQTLWSKAEAVGATPVPVRWHLVGHLQRNKVRRTLPLLALLQTLDSPRLLEAVSAESALLGRPSDVLVEVNLSADPGRSGAAIADVPALVAAAAAAPFVRLRGLMGMASHPDSPAADARRDFARLRELRDRLADVVPEEYLRELSMGMSGDYVEAILEGSTMVRVGSAVVA